MSNPKDRPSLRERYDTYQTMLTKVTELNMVINTLEEVYERLHDEGVYKSLQIIKDLRGRLTGNFNELEIVFRDDEIRELWENLGKFPHAVQTWFLHYRDDEFDYKDESG